MNIIYKSRLHYLNSVCLETNAEIVPFHLAVSLPELANLAFKMLRK